MSRRVTFALLIALTTSWNVVAPQTIFHDKAYPVSLVRVIANPKLFDGRRVRLAGYMAHNGLDRSLGLYMTDSDGRNVIIANSIDLSLEESSVQKLVGKYVIFNGTFHSPVGVLSDYTNGRIDHISELRDHARGDIPK